MTKAERQAYFYQKMSEFGFSFDEANSLRRIEMTLHRWAEAECNGEIQRDEGRRCTRCGYTGECMTCPKCVRPTQDTDGKPRRYYGAEMDRSYPIADRETGALKRLAKIMAAHPEWLSYHQTDPRGCALYIIRRDALPKMFDVLRTFDGWTIQRKGSDKPYSGGSRTKAEAEAFAERETINSYYSQGFGVCF